MENIYHSYVWAQAFQGNYKKKNTDSIKKQQIK